MKILLVEDDALIANLLAEALIDQHYTVDVVADGQAGWELLDSYTYDLVLLDIVLPNFDGISLCRRLRSQGNQTPILLLTAQDTSTNKVIGLDAGADDYVAKPFNLQELLARIRALLRRGGSALPPLLEWYNLKLDPSICAVTCDDQPLHLTPKEYSLLELFLRNPHRIFSTSILTDHLWSFEHPPTDDTIRSHIKGLRQKLKAAQVYQDPIQTVYGIGYRLRAVEEKAGDAKNTSREINQKPTDAELSKAESQTVESQTVESQTVESQTSAGIQEVWMQVKQTIHQRVTVLEQAVMGLLQNNLSEESQQQAEQEAHRLAGSLGMFGADEGSRLAQEIEPLLALGSALDDPQIERLFQLVTELRQVLQVMDTDQVPAIMSEPEVVDNAAGLLLISANPALTDPLATEAECWGMRSQIVSNAVAARGQISNARPNAVVLDFAVDSLNNNLMLLAELSVCMPPVPALVLTEQDSLIDRVKIARLGSYQVLQQPVTAVQVLEAINQLIQHSRSTKAMVLVVDDDLQVLAELQRLLIPWGLYVSILDNPLQFLETLEATAPDLLILDVEMPNINGLDLCQVVRNDPRWSGLPILFLTARTDAETMQQVFMMGADDFVSKPIIGPELVTRIFNRLERSRLLKTLSETDALTGVANRRKSTQELDQFLEWSRHCQQPFCLAIVKIDQLQQINQHYGHAIADQVLARFGELLRQSFHGEDSVGRWGGAEFVVGMAGMTKADGMRRLADLQASLHQFEFRATNGAGFQASFSTGVVQFPQDGEALPQLYRVANDRLLRGG